MAFWLDQVLGRGGRTEQISSDPFWDGVGDWLLRVRHDGVLLASNHPAGTPFPVVRQSDLGRPVGRLFPERAASVLMELLPRTIENHKTSTFEYGFGQNHYAEVRMFPVGDDQVVLVARDLTGRKSTEATLRRGRERYALAVQGANDGLWDWQLDTEQVYWSLQWKALLGLDRDDVPPTPAAWFTRVHPEDLARVRRDLDVHLSGDTPRFENEHRVRHKDGEWLWVLVRGMALRNARGEATRIAGSLTDLTHRRAVAAAQEKSRLLEYATRAVGIGIAILTSDEGLAEVSPTLEEMVQSWVSPGAWWADVVEQAELPRGIRCPQCGRRQRVGSMLAELVAPEGDPRVYEITVTGHAHEVHPDGSAHVVLVEDVTEPKLAEKRLRVLNDELVIARDRALASSRAKSAFLANMSHELRTPLNAIIGYSEMLMEELSDGEFETGAEELTRINNAGSQLLEIIAGVLDLSKIEAGTMTLDIRRFELKDLLAEVVQVVEPQMASAGNTFTWSCSEDLTLHTDAAKLRQVLLNLLDNANKFTEQGSVRMQVTREPAGWMNFRIADSGIGMNEEARNRLFEEFYQGDLSSTKRYAGAGLGLALCQRFVEMLGGEISVESRTNEGSVFTVRLPPVAPDVVDDPTTPPAPERAFTP